MPPTGISPATDRSSFDAAVRRRSWEWLLALRRRLNVDLEIVDESQAPLLGPTPTPLSTNIRALLTAGSPGLRLALSTTLQTGNRQAVSVDGVQVACIPVSMGRVVAGALILAQPRAENMSAERARGALELMGFWLVNAVEAHLTSPLSEEGDLDRLSSLCRLLGDSSTHRTDRDNVAAFAEALAIWHDLEVYGYVETALGEFLREVTLAGADPASSPAVIQRTSLPECPQMTRVSRLDAERLGFSSDQDLVMMRVGGNASPWVIVVCGAVAPGESARLGRYLDLLDQSIVRAVEASASRVVASMARHLLDDEREADAQARRALEDVQDTLGLTSSAVTVATSSGAPVLTAGLAPTVADPADASDGRHLVIVRHLPQQNTMTLVVQWAAGRRVTRQEHQVVHAAADLFESWARRIARQAKGPAERRATPRSYDEDLERFARQAVEGGVPVTAVVLSFSDAALRPSMTQTRVGRLREQMRPTDLVGRLGDGEIGMLLHNTPVGDARSVTARLRRALQDTDDAGAPVTISIGYASRQPGELAASLLAQEARQDALRHAQES